MGHFGHWLRIQADSRCFSSSPSFSLRSEPCLEPVPPSPVTVRRLIPRAELPLTPYAVLDSTSGKPAPDMRIRLDRLNTSGFALLASGCVGSPSRVAVEGGEEANREAFAG